MALFSSSKPQKYTDEPCKSPYKTMSIVRSSKLVQMVGKRSMKSSTNSWESPNKMPNRKSWECYVLKPFENCDIRCSEFDFTTLWHHELILIDYMSSEACVLWSVRPAVGCVCRAEAFNRKWHHLILTVCTDNARSKLCTICLFNDSHTNTLGSTLM